MKANIKVGTPYIELRNIKFNKNSVKIYKMDCFIYRLISTKKIQKLDLKNLGSDNPFNF